MSAIYARRWKKSALQDAAIDECERRGLYFCYSESLRATVAVLNFREYMFAVRLSKVCQEAAEPHHQTYAVPELIDTRRWDQQAQDWVQESVPVDAETQVELQACLVNVQGFGGLFDRPHLFERFAALSVGALLWQYDRQGSAWPDIDCVDSTRLESNETLQRITFAQDTRPAARQFRHDRYLNLQRFEHIRHSKYLPTRMAPFTVSQATFDYARPYSNLSSADGRYATAMYVHNGNERDAQILHTRVQKFLSAEPKNDHDKDHVVVWYPNQPLGAPAVIAYPPESVPKTTDHPVPPISSIASQP